MKKMNNKGFSLVELIIVIAIMAILIAVLAPQYIKYVEKSRQSADLDNYQAIVGAIQVVYGDNDSTMGAGTQTITCSKGSTINCDSDLKTALQDVGVKIDGIKTKSDKFGNATMTVVKDSDGNFTISISGNTDLASELGITS